MSVPKPRNYTTAAKRQLDMLSGSKCCCPECNKSLIARDSESIVGKRCHIEAASPKGARYNSNMTDEERSHIDNLILLCDECHEIIDTNPDKYPVPLLKQWKQNREHEQRTRLYNDTSLLWTAINAIINSELQEDSIDIYDELKAFSISEKIRYNDIKRNKFLMDDHKEHHAKLSSIYSELEDNVAFKKDRLFGIIKNIYLENKGKYVLNHPNEIELVRAHADDIIDGVQNDILDAILEDKTGRRDEIAFGVNMIMADAFMRCKILEEPK